MNKKHNEGFSLVELLVSIVILSAIVLPTCTSLVLSYRLNAKSRDMMQAQLAVSSTVETLMAEGITDDFIAELQADDETDPTLPETGLEGSDTIEGTSDRFPGIQFVLEDAGDYFYVQVMDEDGLVVVNTSIRDKTTGEEGGGT